MKESAPQVLAAVKLAWRVLYRVFFGWSRLPACFMLWLYLILVAFSVVAIEQAVYYHSRWKRAAILLSYYERRVYRLERQQEEYKKAFTILHDEHHEIQYWRTSITLASRQGWLVASRFISEYPLEKVPAMEPWVDALPPIK